MVWERLLGKVMYQASPHKATPTTPEQFAGEGYCCKVLVSAKSWNSGR